MVDILSMSVPSKPEYVGVVRLAVSSIANRIGFDIEQIEDIKIAVAEACTNAMLHGKKADDFNYEIKCAIAQNKMTVYVTDKGKGYDQEEYVEPSMGALNEGGLGIFVIKSLMDEVEIFSESGEGTTMKMTKFLGESA